ncbi:beta-eliminating lyase-related protein [Vibrio sp. SS-MA-C1-2]|uniref:threonine aldolase family protein n=1 Tax=Vibrio sp. SS-MA-C1-2 TaxID=2908646 RepID=UPI001F332D14|nr:beta-eliminating lyase-related protein [Vibrio sp. SS-MA-C1-2]UJF18213.1 beta-eliminating lyase-related protein [Vibrio sp. SS-MA-C1-2]
MTLSLRDSCETILSGHKQPRPSELYQAMAEWCEKHNIKDDVYGEGETIQQFEDKVAKLLGFECGLFFITGTMTQPTALQLACEARQSHLVAMHPSSHIYIHEKQNYQLQNRFNILPVGNPYQPWKVSDLKKWPDKIAAALYELPMREIGGQLPSWQELDEIKAYCREQDIHLHMDGARLWETGAYYQKAYNEIANGFDSCYISLYKGINGLGGAMLLSDKKFIDNARFWMQRQGGSVYHRTPYIVSAAMQFDQRLAAMPTCFERTKALYQIIAEYPQLQLNPQAPQASMLHLHLPVSAKRAIEIRDQLAVDQKVWFGNPRQGELANQSVVEWYVGDTLVELDDDKLRTILNYIIKHC